LTYAASTTAGDTITVNTTGLYAITFTVPDQTGGFDGITKNTANTVNVASATISNVLSVVTVIGPASGNHCGYTGLLNAGDVIRFVVSAHTNTINTGADAGIINMAKIGV
jgi:hypothetical protein